MFRRFNDRRAQDNRMTKTGETFGERAAYHRRGELSPGEHGLARAIRESLGRSKEDSIPTIRPDDRKFTHCHMDNETLGVLIANGFTCYHTGVDWYDTNFCAEYNGAFMVPDGTVVYAHGTVLSLEREG